VNMNKRLIWISIFFCIATVILSGCVNDKKNQREDSVMAEEEVDSLQIIIDQPGDETDITDDTDTDEKTDITEETDETAIEEEIMENQEMVKDAVIEEWINSHSMEEKIAQMFMITPEALTGVDVATVAADTTREKIKEYPVGGIIYFRQNFVDTNQTESMINNTLSFYEEQGLIKPFISVDEEGGSVTRIPKDSDFEIEVIPSMKEIGKSEDISQARNVGASISKSLKKLGFNMDMAPVADVLSNSGNSVIGDRSFGSDPKLVSDMVINECLGMKDNGIIPVIKHFPGHGATLADSHEGYAYTDKSMDELMECELVPFIYSIENGIEVIMVGHISLPNITGDNIPCSLSSQMLDDFLRKQVGYNGIIITDAMNMGAISTKYSCSQSTVMAIKAGVDIILMPSDFTVAYQEVIKAVETGEIEEERIDASVRRILEVKINNGIIEL